MYSCGKVPSSHMVPMDDVLAVQVGHPSDHLLADPGHLVKLERPAIKQVNKTSLTKFHHDAHL